MTTRRREVALAGHVGDLDGAVEGLSDADPAVRGTAIGAMARLGALDLDLLERNLSDPAPSVRARAAELAIPFGAPGADLLTHALSDPDPVVVEAACFALGEIGEAAGTTANGVIAPAVTALCSVSLGHRDPLCREAAVAALGAIGHQSGLPAILAAADDKPAVRRRAVLALAPFSGPEVEAALARALTDRDWQVRQAAEDLTSRS